MTAIVNRCITTKCLAPNKRLAIKGFTIIELMIGIAVSIIVMAGVTNVFVATVKSSSETLKSSKLNQDLQAIMSIMTNDIRRAGYWNSLASNVQENPFTAAENINIISLNVANDCVLYAYDRDNNGTIPATNTSSNERLGFRLDGGDIWMRRTGKDMIDCSNSARNWNRINDEKTEEITELTFTPDFKCINKNDYTTVATACSSPPVGTTSGETLVEVRYIKISMTGTLTSDNSTTKQIDSSVKIRNDRIFTQP